MARELQAAVAVAALLGVLVCSATAATVFPKPQSQTGTNTTLVIDTTQFRFAGAGPGGASQIVLNGFKRYFAIMFGEVAGNRAPPSGRVGAGIALCTVTVASADESLTLETSEKYSLTVAATGIAINADTVYGALRGLETLSQLVVANTVVETTIQDFPRYQFRATMIDTSRHFYPVAVILQHLDAMSYSKFNVLHWHIVDSISFPYESSTFPEMSREGAYSPSHVYTHDDIAAVIDYARHRGIRVIPEFDTPGHVQAGYEALSPKVLADCYSDGKITGTGPMNPTLNATYDFLTKFWAEVKEVFTDKFVHVGGDEVPSTCWASNPQIQDWVKQHPEIKTFGELEQYYELKLLNILKAQGTSYIAWQEVFDNGVQLLPDTVVDVWKGGWQEEMANVTAAGYHTVLSSPFYLNYISYGEDWPKYYSVEPSNFTGGDEADKKGLVGGVEVCMWSEFVDAANFIPRIWPRASAVGERGWSDKTVRDVDDARDRLHEFRCKLVKRGIPAEPITNGGRQEMPTGSFCPEEWIPHYRPPWGQ